MIKKKKIYEGIIMNKKYIYLGLTLTLLLQQGIYRVYKVNGEHNLNTSPKVLETSIEKKVVSNNEINNLSRGTSTIDVNKEYINIKNEFIANNPIKKIIWDKAEKHGLPYQYIYAICVAESDLDPNCIGPDTQFGNAHGIMQLLPETAKELGVNNIKDPEENIEGGVKYLKTLYDRYKDKNYIDNNGNKVSTLTMVTIAYNWGPENLDAYYKRNECIVVVKDSKYNVPMETYYYVQKINKIYSLK